MTNPKNSNSQKRCIYYIKGMHCASCEVLIEKKLLKHQNIELADASVKDGKVEMRYQGSKKPDIAKINQEFKEFGYQFKQKPYKKSKDMPLFSITKNGSIATNKSKLNNLFKTLAVVFSLVIAFFVFESLQLGRFVSVDSGSALPAFLALGLIAGFSSCAALVGGLLLSLIKQWNEVYIDSSSMSIKSQPHVMFHAGRLLSFFILGGILGLAGNAFSLNNLSVFAVLTLAVSLIMFVLAMQMLGVEWAQRFRLSAPKFVTGFVADESNFQGKFMPFVTGALTFFLPCGFTLIAQTIALTSGSITQGGFIMFFFALGTLPALVGISLSGLKFNKKPHLTAKFNVIAGIIIIFFAAYNVNGQLNVLGLPSLSDVNLDVLAGSDEKKTEGFVEINENGEQVLNFVAKGFDYIPVGSTTLKAGVKTRMVVDNQGISGCGAFMTAKGLFDGYVPLKSGENVVEFTPQKGTYKLTCTMGMVSPVIIKVIN